MNSSFLASNSGSVGTQKSTALVSAWELGQYGAWQGVTGTIDQSMTFNLGLGLHAWNEFGARMGNGQRG
jgi:hypothetical protein